MNEVKPAAPPASKDIDLCGVPLGRARHACAFFNSKEDQYRALMPFLTEGFEMGDRNFHIVDPKRIDEHRRILHDAGVDTDKASESGQLVIKGWDEAYLLDGRFDQDRMIAMIEEILQEGARGQYRLTRFMADVEWAIEDRPGVMDLVEYETRLNYVLPKYDDALTCVYDLAQFGAETVMDIMRTHPMVIIGGALFENPFYVPPDQMLKELRERARRPERHR